MANNISAFFETLLAASAEYNESVVGQTALIDGCYLDISTEAARIGQTVQIPFPDTGPMKNYSSSAITADDVNTNSFNLVFQTRLGKGLLFTDFQQYQTATQLAKKFLRPLHNRALEAMNGQVAALITPANFNANAPIVGPTQGEVLVTDQLKAWDKLADAKVPLDDASMLKLFVHNNVYRKMLGDNAWVQENVVGALIAERARTTGKLANAFNFEPRFDQQMPTSSNKVIYGQISVTNGSATVTGTASAFSTDLAVGSILTFGADASQTQYTVSAIASDTSLTLSATYSGTTAAQTSARVQTVLAGTVGATNGSAAVTGSGTSFATALSVGQWIVFSNDATATPYQVLAIASNTALTLASNYAGSTATGLKGTVLAYQCLAAHEYSIALGLRPIETPPEAADVVDVMYLDLKGVPFRVIISYQHIYQALFVTIDFGFATGVMRPSFGCLIQV